MTAPGPSDDYSWDFAEDQGDDLETPIDDVSAVYQQLMKDGTNLLRVSQFLLSLWAHFN